MTARVLIVDDNSANRRLLEARLTAEYFTVQTASNGADALAMCSVDLPDVILLDVMMPGMDGYEVCRRIRRTDPDGRRTLRPGNRHLDADGRRRCPRRHGARSRLDRHRDDRLGRRRSPR